MNKKFIFRLLIGFAMAALPLAVFAGVPTDEQDEGPYSLLGESDRWAKITYENWWHNNEALKATKKIDEKKKGMRDTAQNTAKRIQGLRDSSHADLVMDPQGNSFDLEIEGREDIREVLDEIYLSGYIDPNGEVKIITGKQPIWKVIKKDGESGRSSFNKRTNDLLVKVAFKWKKARAQDISDFENIVRDISVSMLPGKMLKDFNPRKIAAEVMKKAGIVQVADGITMRPTVPQDKIFAEFANLGCDLTDETLFWSDPSVSQGYHPVFGTAFNKTKFRGVKQIDVDNVVSRGWSEAITKWNQIHSDSDRMKNPFQGYSAKVIPGLIVMGEQGRLTSYEDPSREQIEEAQRISKNLRMLPSQCMYPRARKVSSSAEKRVIKPIPNFKFKYPSKAVFIAGSESTKEERERDAALNDSDADGQSDGENVSSKTYDVKLSKLDAKVYDNAMKLNKKRLLEISRLKDENLRGRRYINAIIESYIQMETDAASVAQGMNQTNSIPQITQLRQSIFAALEEVRWRLSQLHFQYDDLKQKEWEVLLNILHTERESIQKMMDQAAVRYRTTVLDIEKGLEGLDGPTTE